MAAGRTSVKPYRIVTFVLLGRSHQLTHPKTVHHKVRRAFQLAITDLTSPGMPAALGSFTPACNISDEDIKWMTIFILKIKDGALYAFQSFVQSRSFPGGVRVEQLRADENGQFIGNEFKGSCR